MNVHGQQDRIQKWITAIMPGNSQDDRAPWGELPVCQPVSTSSALKKRKRESGDDCILITATPAPSRRPVPVISQPQPSIDAPRIRWSKNLLLLTKPVQFKAMPDNAVTQLPEDVRALYSRVYDLAIEHKEIFDCAVRQEITAIIGREPKEEWFTKPSALPQSSEITPEDRLKHTHHLAMRRLQLLHKIRRGACRAMSDDDPHKIWHEVVYQKLRRIDLTPRQSVGLLHLADARISPAFYPGSRVMQALPNDAVMEYTLAYTPWEYSCCPKQEAAEEMIERCVDAVRGSQKHINATEKAKTEPISIHIATSFLETPDEGRARLGIWTAAWYRRMRALLDLRKSMPGTEVPRMITLPLIHVVEHEWKLLFASDGGGHVQILGDISIGNTKSILGVHILAAVLKELAQWIDSVFADWIQDTLSYVLGKR